MYRLLIVDDEPVIVNGLIQLFQENTEFELDVCKAYSAAEALNTAKKMKLDILVSDIRMPQKTGLQLVDEIAYYWPHCRIIFLTGYSEFDYVQAALRKSADNYILKTEGIDPIFRAVAEACHKLDEENCRRVREEKANMHFQIAAPVLKNERVRRMLKGESAASLLTDPRYEELDFRLNTEEPSFLVIGSLDNIEDLKAQEALESVQRAFNNNLPDSIAYEPSVTDEHRVAWLLQPQAELLGRFQHPDPEAPAWKGFMAYMKGILELVQNECERLLGASVSFGVSGDLSKGWETIQDQYNALLGALESRASLGQKMIVIDIEQAHQKSSLDPRQMKQEDMKSWVINQIQNFIQHHLSGDVSLTAIAEHVHFNPSYLSRYYKQMTGQNLQEYIQSKKLESALHLMQHTNLKLIDIAARVGFDSHSYFTTFFKKKMGISPQEYRNSK
ncbi:response regulator [Paenibacillus sp. XY044]|uniref:response regulator transcription factor n=1 Tax=Paenibacillus sp. XY044 TaxID=2026089 RepID=UPI000B98AC81|nr:response regulator [Paenibacillus sp. XY044]OZB98353.1 DNA-binding response regulator [Paenibacillus sp. XY044]